ncbi:MAG: NDP-sugar synthase [Candidatus Goldiibacteriota bacterium]
MKALILIGGEGTRLRPLTINTLKCMVPIANRHFFEYQIALLKKYGIKDIILSICYMPARVKKAVGDGKKYGVRISYVAEKAPLGTAGAIKNAQNLLDKETLIMNGDILTDIKLDELLKYHESKNADATIALHEAADPSAYGLVLSGRDGMITRFLEKPKESEITSKWINAGVYIFSKKAVDMIPAGMNVSVERQTFPLMIEKKARLAAFKSSRYWLDIGKIDKYIQANFDVLQGRFESLFGDEIADTGVKAGSLTRIDTDAVISSPVIIGKKCLIAKGARIERSIIWDNVSIEEGARITNSVIGSNCTIGANSTVINTVAGDGSVFTRFTRSGTK